MLRIFSRHRALARNQKLTVSQSPFGESAPGMESRVSIGSSPETEAIEMKNSTGDSTAMAKPVMSSASTSAAITNSPSYDFGQNPWGNNWMNQNYHSGWNRRYKGYGTQTLASEASKAAIPSPQNTKKIDTEVSITEISAQPKNEEMDACESECYRF
ncbi:hypothetical protein ACOME3_005189 [Neoechinorhynchus agilis]